MKPEEPCELRRNNEYEKNKYRRLSSTVPWERKGEIPLRDPITCNNDQRQCAERES